MPHLEFITPFRPRRTDKVSERFFAPRAHSLFGAGAMQFATVIEQSPGGVLIVSPFRANQLNWGLDDPSGTMSLQLVCAQAADTPGDELSTMVTSGEALEPVDEKIHAGRLEVAGSLADIWKVIPLDPDPGLGDPVTRERSALPDSIYGNSLRGGSGLLVMASLEPSQGLILTPEGMGPMLSFFTMGSFPTDENDFRCQDGSLPLAAHNRALFSSQKRKVTNEPSTALPLRFGAPEKEGPGKPAKPTLVFSAAGFVSARPLRPGEEAGTLAGRTGRVTGGVKTFGAAPGRLGRPITLVIRGRGGTATLRVSAKDQDPNAPFGVKPEVVQGFIFRNADKFDSAGKVTVSGGPSLEIESRQGGKTTWRGRTKARRAIKTFCGKLVPFSERDQKPKNKSIDGIDPLVTQIDHAWAPCIPVDTEELQGKQDKRPPPKPGPPGPPGPRGPKGPRGPRGPGGIKQRPPRGPGSKKGNKKKKGSGSKQQRSPFGGTKGANRQGSSSDVVTPTGRIGEVSAGAPEFKGALEELGIPTGIADGAAKGSKALEDLGQDQGRSRSDCPKPPDDKSGGSPKTGDGVEADSIEVADDLDLGEEVSVDELPASSDDTTPAPTPAEGTPTDKTAKKCPTVDPRMPTPIDERHQIDPETGRPLDGSDELVSFEPVGDRIDPVSATLANPLEFPGSTTISEAMLAAWNPTTGEFKGVESVGASGELGGYAGDPRTAFLQEPSGRWNTVSVPAPGDLVDADEMAALVNAFRPPGLGRTPPPGMPGASRDLWGYAQQLQAQLDEMQSVIDAALIGDRSPYYEGNIGVIHTNQPVTKDGGEGVAENYIGNHYIDPESGPDDSLAAGLNVLQAVEGDRKQVTVDRATLRVQRHLHGRVIASADLGRPVIAAEKHTTGGAIDKSPWVGAWEGPGLTPPFALSHSGALGLRSQNFVPADEQIAGLAHFFNRGNRPFFQTAAPNPRIMDLAAFQGFDGINVSDYAEGFTSWNVDEDGNVIVSSEAEQARLGYPSFAEELF